MDPELYVAVMSGKVEFLHLNANRQDFYLSQQTPENSTVLHIAVAFQQLEFARELIQLDSSLVQRANIYGDTPLHLAAETGNFKIVQLFISWSDLEDSEIGLWWRKNRINDTVLHIAARNGHLDVVNLLVSTDPELSGFSNNENETPIFVAIEGGFMEIASLILTKTSRSSHCGGRNGMTALHVAVIRTHPYKVSGSRAQQKNTDIVEELLQKFPNMIKQADGNGWTALHYAADLGHIEAIKILLKHDSSIAYHKTKSGMSALHIAAMAGDINVTREIILNRPDACYMLDEMHQTVLHVAVKNGKDDLVDHILANRKMRGVLNLRDKNGNTPLHLAALYAKCDSLDLIPSGYEILVFLMWDKRVDKNIVNKNHLRAADILKDNKDILRFKHLFPPLFLSLMKSKPSLERVMDRKNDTDISEENIRHPNQMENEKTDSKDLKDISATNLLVATLIAAITFAAGFTVPGGYIAEGHEGGMPILKSKIAFYIFIMAVSIGFYCSTVSILFSFFSSFEKKRPLLKQYVRTAAKLMYISVIAVIVAFGSGLCAIMPPSTGLSTASLGVACFLVVIFSMKIFVIKFCLYLLNIVLQKMGMRRWKDRPDIN